MDLEKDKRKRTIVFGTLRRAQASVDAERWFVFYYAARDEGASHERAMDLADRAMGERHGEDQSDQDDGA